MSEVRIDVENVIQLMDERRQINITPLEDIEFWHDGLKVDIPIDEIANFMFTGLSNTDFIMDREWPDNPKFNTK